MNVDAMPHTLLIILAEMTVGSLIILQAIDGRGLVPRGFVRLSAASIWAVAGLMWWLALALPSGGDVDGYPLDDSALTAIRWSAFLVFAFALPYTAFSLGQARLPALVWGVASTIAGIALLLAIAALVSPATWGYAGVALSLLVGALAVGGVTMAMILGHWYLVTPRLPSRPLDIVTFGLIIALVAQGVLLVVNLIVPVRETPASQSDLSLGEHPAFWMRILALLLPMALSWMAWRSSRERAMNAATGLLYLAMAAVLGGELLARGLLFVSAKAV